MYGGDFLLQGGEFQRPWKRCSMVANRDLEIEIAMGAAPVPISVSRTHFALRYEVPKVLARGGHLCMAVLTITALQWSKCVRSLGGYRSGFFDGRK